MFSIPGFNPQKFSDGELYDKHSDLLAKKVQAYRLGMGDVIFQLQNMIDAIDFERRERVFNSGLGKYLKSSSPVVFETDPILQKSEESITDVETTDKKNSNTRPIRRPIRTSQPVKPNEGTS